MFLQVSIILFTRGGLVPVGSRIGEGSGPGWVPGLGGAWWRPPGRLLLRAVRILLECILVELHIVLKDTVQRYFKRKIQIPERASISNGLFPPPDSTPTQILVLCRFFYWFRFRL